MIDGNEKINVKNNQIWSNDLNILVDSYCYQTNSRYVQVVNPLAWGVRNVRDNDILFYNLRTRKIFLELDYINSQ